MRIECQFYADKLPLSYRMGMVSLIKECLKKANPDVYQRYFKTNGSTPKPYAFAVYLQNYQMDQQEFHIDGFKLFLTSSDFEFMIPFLNGLQQLKEFQYKNYSFVRGPIRFLPEVKVRHSKIVAKTLSPILVENRNKEPVAPHDPSYNEELNFICQRLSLTLRQQPLRVPIRLTPINMRRTVIKERNEVFEQHQKDKHLFFTAYQGKFVLEGDPVDLQWLVDNGMALRTGQGFGCIAMEREVH